MKDRLFTIGFAPKKIVIISVSLILSLLVVGGCGPTTAQPSVIQDSGRVVSEDRPPVDAEVLVQFEQELEFLRQALKIPGMSAAIVQNQELVWTKGFGYADIENKVEATPDTPYLLASVTKPIASNSCSLCISD